MSYDAQTPPSFRNPRSSKHFKLFCTAGLGVMLLALLMVVWSVALEGNRFSSGGARPSSWKVQLIVFMSLLVGMGMLLLFLCRNMGRIAGALIGDDNTANTRTEQRLEEERQAEQERHQAVPSYEEVVGSDHYLFRSVSMQTPFLPPTYEELMERPQGGVESGLLMSAVSTVEPLTPPPLYEDICFEVPRMEF